MQGVPVRRSKEQGEVPIERLLTEYDNKTDRLVAEFPFRSFDLEDFKRHFGVTEEHDPLMYDVYPVTQDDVGFILTHLDREVAFDFERCACFVECFSSEA